MDPSVPSSSESLTTRSTESMEIDTLSVLGNSPPRSVNASLLPAVDQAIITAIIHSILLAASSCFAFSFAALHLRSRWFFKKQKSKLVSIFWCSRSYSCSSRSVASLAINYSHSVNSHSRRVRRKRPLFCSVLFPLLRPRSPAPQAMLPWLLARKRSC
jgi:hypothetical protein